MTLPVGLVPVTVFVLTVGVSVPVTVGAHLFSRSGDAEFGPALRAALAEAGLLYLVGVLVVWSMARGLGFWKLAGLLVAFGVVAFLVLTALPLWVGRHLVARVGGVDSETALRFSTYGWPVAMLAVFAIFVAPGGVSTNAVFHFGTHRICLAGFCAVSLGFAGAVVLALLVAVFGPGLVGVAVASSGVTSGGTGAKS